MEAQVRLKKPESPFAGQVLVDAQTKVAENTGEAFRILGAAVKSFERAGIKESEISKVLAEIKKGNVDVKVSFGVQYG